MLKASKVVILFVLLGACEKGTHSQTLDQAPDLDIHPRAVQYEPRSAVTVPQPSPRDTPVKGYFEPQATGSVVPGDGFAMTANHVCPIMQKMKLNATTAVENTVEFEGKTVGFCCADCVEAWNSMSDDDRRVLLTKVIKPK